MSIFVKLAISALLFFSTSLASSDAGFKFGVGLTGFNGDDAKEFDSEFGFEIGGTKMIPLNNIVTFNPQLLFAYRSASMSEPYDETNELTFTFTDMAIEVPVLFCFHITPAFFLQAGPQLGLLISSKIKAELGDESASDDILDNRAKLEYGLAVGAGFQITENWAVDLKYNYGLNSFDEDGDAEMSPYQFMLGGSYLF